MLSFFRSRSLSSYSIGSFFFCGKCFLSSVLRLFHPIRLDPICHTCRVVHKVSECVGAWKCSTVVTLNVIEGQKASVTTGLMSSKMSDNQCSSQAMITCRLGHMHVCIYITQAYLYIYAAYIKYIH